MNKTDEHLETLSIIVVVLALVGGFFLLGAGLWHLIHLVVA